MSNIVYLTGKQLPVGSLEKHPPTQAASLTPNRSKGWVGNDPLRLDHDRYPRLRAHRYCLQCGGPKPQGLLRCATCNAFDVSRKFLGAAERYLGGEPRQFPSHGPVSGGRDRRAASSADVIPTPRDPVVFIVDDRRDASPPRA